MWSDGEFVIIVGPSGCGKSTLLRVIAGLEDATSGSVRIDGEEVLAKPPSERGIAMVFQTYALYPHLNVRDNMALGLKQAKLPRPRSPSGSSEATRMLSLDSYLERRPAELSGGQRQRVAIGRAIVRKPKLFLFDEPLSNLDSALRVNTRLEIARLHRELGATMIYVTHDQTEAMTLARQDRHSPRRPHRADRQPDGAVRQSRQHVRCRLHRLAADELHPGLRPGPQRRRHASAYARSISASIQLRAMLDGAVVPHRASGRRHECLSRLRARRGCSRCASSATIISTSAPGSSRNSRESRVPLRRRSKDDPQP